MDLRDIKAFDEFVKNSLDKVEIPYDATSWSSLQEKWSQRSEVPIDDLAEEALSDLKIAYEPSSWDTMHSKWSESQAAELDQMSRRAVGHLSVPYEPASWAVLLERLENVEYKRRLIALKMLEAAAVILLLITLGRYTGSMLENRTDNQKAPQEQLQVPNSSEKLRTEKQEMALIPETVDQQNKFDAQVHIANEDATSSFVHVDGIRGTADRSQQQIAQNVAKSSPFKVTAPPDLVENDALRKDTETPLTPVDQVALLDAESNLDLVVDQDKKSKPANFDQLVLKTHFVNYQRLDAIDAFAAKSSSAASDMAIASVSPIAAQSILKTRVGVYSQVSKHRLQSNVPLRRGEIFEQKMDDVGGGFMANLQFGRLGLDLGLGYEKIIFSAPNIYQFAPNEVHKVHLPLHLRVNAVYNPRFNVYAKAGVAAHGVVFARYHEGSTTLRGAPSATENGFNDGLLVDGGLKDNNFFLMKNVGIGADGMINKDFSVFAEALYQDNLSGSIGSLFGGDRHTIRSYSLLVGVLYHFD